MTFSTAFQANAFQNNAFQIAVTPPPVDTGARGGFIPYAKGERRKRGLEWDRKETDWKAELERAYGLLTGELVESIESVAEVRAAVVPHAAPSDTKLPPIAAIDFAALAADLESARALLAAYEAALIVRDMRERDQDDEEALLLLA
jgi:hypothetical protein